MIINNSGGAALNFTVVGGASAPSSPAENTIWVNTSTSITSWVFSADEPESPSAGMVWFNTATGSTVAFNALKKNNITVCPTSCQQYISGAWVSKIAMAYQGGAWVEISALTLTLFEAGITASEVGSWVATTISENGSSKPTAPTVGTISIGNPLTITMSATAGGTGTVRSENLIRVTPFTKLVATVKSSTGHNNGNLIMLLPEGATVFEDAVAYVTVPKSGSGDYEIPIENVSGEYYVGIGVVSYANAVKMEISKILLS